MYAVFDAGTIEGRRKPVARSLGAQAIRLNRFDSQPGQEGFAHDERESGQEEIYVALAGSGALRIGAEEVALSPGLFVLVSADEQRQVVAGPEGLSYLVVGAAAGEPRNERSEPVVAADGQPPARATAVSAARSDERTDAGIRPGGTAGDA